MIVNGLFGKPGVTNYQFNDDLNILTGRNGSGKTTIMKLAWSVISGNILLALREINFKTCTVHTDEYTCTVIRTASQSCRIELEIDGNTYELEDDDDEDPNSFTEYAENKAQSILVERGSSIFFPTFRRIEGGFWITPTTPHRARPGAKTAGDLEESLVQVSRKLSSSQHSFVAALSSQDIVSLLLKRYTVLSEEINNFQGEVTKSVIEKIRQYENTQNSRQDADSLLSETRAEIEKIEDFSSRTLTPLNAVRDLVESLFQHTGISFGTRLNFGDAAAAVTSDALSAGEKQMLSFICYNAFNKNSIIFIDEPELSLHVDWQRKLYSILESQGSGNQFIFATHSPFIYAKYPDKEVSVGIDKGE
ncbi:AAA family ATPase [Burkholderia plantarii]|uniref:AAA family ATPase n=1 Tax=Burkholderia plantarii TaxID=41899 RepID=UPI0018DCC638|nr:ATP-binding protein [Burkholderia plantarii]MBI0325474.1 ATP-binding protein [Burkholderia plantarii]